MRSGFQSDLEFSEQNSREASEEHLEPFRAILFEEEALFWKEESNLCNSLVCFCVYNFHFFIARVHQQIQHDSGL